MVRRETFHTAPAEVVKDIGAWRYRGELETTGLKKGKIYCGFRKKKKVLVKTLSHLSILGKLSVSVTYCCMTNCLKTQ